MTSSTATTLSILTDTSRPDWRRFPDAVGFVLADIEGLPTAQITANTGEKVKVNFEDLTLFTNSDGAALSIVAKSNVPKGQAFHKISVSGDEWLNAFELYVIAASKL